MIVKNEARVIQRCLESVRPLADYFLIEDTGSTDGTQDVIRLWLDQNDLPGEVFEEPWRDFAHNRSIALARLRKSPEIDYGLIIDADDTLVCEKGFRPETFKAELTTDLYYVKIRQDPIQHYRAQLCSNHLDFHYRGILHEFILGPPVIRRGRRLVFTSKRESRARAARRLINIATTLGLWSGRYRQSEIRSCVRATPFTWHRAGRIAARPKRRSPRISIVPALASGRRRHSSACTSPHR
jgi:glycosyltransferase involved in cell wall biosynthesis